MYDADGPAVANAVYSAFFGRGAVQVLSASVMVDLIIEGYALQASKSWQEFDLESVTNTISSTLEDCRREWAVFTPTEIPELIRRCYMATSTQPVLDEDVETIQGPLLEYALTSQPQFNFSMAHAIDELSRYLRVEKKVPPSRWATFVHIGI